MSSFALRDIDEATSTKMAEAPATTAHSKTAEHTPTTTNEAITASLTRIPTTLETSVVSSSTSNFGYPYPGVDGKQQATATASGNGSTPTSTLAKQEAEIKWLKSERQHMIIALAMFALFIVLVVAFKLWMCIHRRKKAALEKGMERTWFGRTKTGKMATKVAGHFI